MSHAPQNPYRSFLLSASAGSGKTYQLSQRFLCLVAAGAAPAHILTITFTIKAAAEMRQRILDEATHLLKNQTLQAAFNLKMQEFFVELNKHQTHPTKPPLDALQTAATILASSQQLRIATIDSVFYDWLKKFAQDGAKVRIADQHDLSTIAEQAFDKLWEHLSAQTGAQIFSQPLLKAKGILGLKTRFDQIANFDSFLWLAKKMRGDELPLNTYDIAREHFDEASEAALVDSLSSDLEILANAASVDLKQKILEAIATKDLALLTDSGLMNQDLRVSGRYFRGKKREALADVINRTEESYRCFINEKMLLQLNNEGAFLLGLYEQFTKFSNAAKARQQVVDFSDLAKICYHLFHGDEGIAARFLIIKNTKHLLIDEFQDTSRLQWSIFSSLANEILSGDGVFDDQSGAPATVFIVGDKKQSIYGFREADPEIMDEATNYLNEFGATELQQQDNYRSAPLILEFVNAACANLFKHFPPHSAATTASGSTLVPDRASIWVSDIFTAAGEGSEESAAEQEARYVAAFLKASLSNRPLKVYDKKAKAMRPLVASDCVLLYRNSTYAGFYEAALRREGIACVSQNSQEFFSRSEITDLVALMRYLALPFDMLSLVTVLKSPLVNLADVMVLEALQRFKDAVSAVERGEQMLAELTVHYPEVGERIKALQLLTTTMAPHRVLIEALKVFDAPAAYRRAYDGVNGELAVANLSQLVEVFIKLEQQGFSTLFSLCHQLEALAKEDQIGNANIATNAVRMMTIHAAKGLEFPFVMLTDAAKKWEKRDRYWIRSSTKEQVPGLYYAGTSDEQPRAHKQFDAVYRRLDEELREESSRLLYVALTRAEQYLLITGNQAKRGPNLAEGLYDHFSAAIKSLGAEQTMVEGQSCWFIERFAGNDLNDKPQTTCLASALPIPEQRRNASAYQIKTVSPHSLTAAKKASYQVPLKPELQSDAAQLFGQVLHRCLEWRVRNLPIEKEPLMRSLSLPTLADATWMQAQHKILEIESSPVWKELMASATNIRTELPVAHLSDNYLTRGFIDLYLETSHNVIKVIDYKTTERHEDANIYSPQLRAYAKAIKAIHPTKKITGSVFFTNQLVLKDLFTL